MAMQSGGRAADTRGNTPDAGNVQLWSWTGTLSEEQEEDASYYTIIKIGPDEGIQISLSDGTDSYEVSLTRDQLVKICEKPCLAHVDAHQRISRIQAALNSDENETVRVIRRGDNLELRVSVSWGSEYSDLSIKVDIAGVPLHRSLGNWKFLDSAFEDITKTRALTCERRDQRLKLELEVEELWEAKKRLDVIAQKRDERMQVFADALNEYKRKMSAESTKREEHRPEKDIGHKRSSTKNSADEDRGKGR